MRTRHNRGAPEKHQAAPRQNRRSENTDDQFFRFNRNRCTFETGAVRFGIPAKIRNDRAAKRQTVLTDKARDDDEDEERCEQLQTSHTYQFATESCIEFSDSISKVIP